MQIIKNFYRAVVPDNLRRKIWIYRDRNSENGLLRREILNYYENLPEKEKSGEVNDVLHFIRKYGVVTLPYAFTHKYDPGAIEVQIDAKLNLPYVLQDGKRLYYKRSWDASVIKENFNFLSIEQDIQSPHRYLTNTFYVDKDDVIVDIGAAEGNFALSIVERASKVFIFETDEEWIEALQATFAPWQEKVQIVNKYVSDTVDVKNITLDEFFKDKAEVDFIKTDVEGAEALVLKGAHKVLEQNNHLKVAVCTYHKQNDSIELAAILKKHKLHVTFSDGYMLFLEDKQTPPYLRKGLIRAYK